MKLRIHVKQGNNDPLSPEERSVERKDTYTRDDADGVAGILDALEQALSSTVAVDGRIVQIFATIDYPKPPAESTK